MISKSLENKRDNEFSVDSDSCERHVFVIVIVLEYLALLANSLYLEQNQEEDKIENDAFLWRIKDYNEQNVMKDRRGGSHAPINMIRIFIHVMSGET